MKEMNIFVVMCILFLGLLNASESNTEVSKSSSYEPINVIVILDTSDRISKQDQVKNDIEIVKEIITQFDKLIKDHLGKINVSNNESIKYPHCLTFVVPDQPKTPSIPPQIVRELEIRDPGNGNGYPEFEAYRDSLLSEIPKLYDFVEQYKQTGSDIWGWFQDEADDYLIEGYQNRIVCLSDGYLIFDGDIPRPKGTCMHVKNGKIDMSKPLSMVDKGFGHYNVSFLMVEIDMKDQGDFENMKKYWKAWLETMGIKETDFAKRGRWLRKIQSFIFPE